MTASCGQFPARVWRFVLSETDGAPETMDMPVTGNTERTQPENRLFYPALDGLRAIAFSWCSSTTTPRTSPGDGRVWTSSSSCPASWSRESSTTHERTFTARGTFTCDGIVSWGTWPMFCVTRITQDLWTLADAPASGAVDNRGVSWEPDGNGTEGAAARHFHCYTQSFV